MKVSKHVHAGFPYWPLEDGKHDARGAQRTVFAEISAHPEISAHRKWWFFKGESTQNRWALMGDFSKGGVHKTDGFWLGLEMFFSALKN